MQRITTRREVTTRCAFFQRKPRALQRRAHGAALYNCPSRIEPLAYAVSPSTGSTPADGLSRDAAALEGELAGVIVQALNLEVAPAQIDAAAPLYGEGLGLDSIDILELALEVSQRYGFQLRADDENNQQIFRSLRTLAAHVAQHRTR